MSEVKSHLSDACMQNPDSLPKSHSGLKERKKKQFPPHFRLLSMTLSYLPFYALTNAGDESLMGSKMSCMGTICVPSAPSSDHYMTTTFKESLQRSLNTPSCDIPGGEEMPAKNYCYCFWKQFKFYLLRRRCFL